MHYSQYRCACVALSACIVLLLRCTGADAKKLPPLDDPEWPATEAGADFTSLRWTDVQTLGVRGRAFDGQARKGTWFSRFPAAAEKDVRAAVWGLSQDSAGMYVEFVSDASSIAVNYTLLSEDIAMWHFPSTGVAGCDLYAYDTTKKVWRWVGTAKPTYPITTGTLVSGAPTDTNTSYRLHLPTYNSPVEMHVGVAPRSSLVAAPVPSPPLPKVVHYGTSIAQGAVASRPGQAYTNIISRDLGIDIYNFGFSGNGIMEEGVAKWLVQIKPDIFVVDCLPNMQPEMVAQRTQPLVKYIRAALPDTPIVLSEGTTYGAAWYSNKTATVQQGKRTNLRAAYEALVQAGDGNLYYVEGPDIFDSAGEGDLENPTVGGTHPTDLGMQGFRAVYDKLLPTLLHKTTRHLADAATAAGRVERVVTTDDDVATHRMSHSTRTLFPDEVEQVDRISADIGVRSDIEFTDARSLTIGGRYFNDSETFYNRLPAAAKGVVRDKVYGLSEMSTGMWVRFDSNATEIFLNLTLANPPNPLWHMPQTGTSGCDLFRYDEGNKTWRWVGTISDFSHLPGPAVVGLASDLPPAETAGASSYILYFPLRNWPLSVQVGVPTGSAVGPAGTLGGVAPSFHADRPIVWYGTSILQGGVASRAGNAYSNIITRRLGTVVANFGFAGNGVMETSVAQFLTTLDASIIVIDCLPNMNAETVASRTQPLVRYFREHGHETTPIVLTEGTQYGDDWFVNNTATEQQRKRAALKAAYEALVAAGDKNLHYQEGPPLYQHNNADLLTNPTVGGTHPSDLGQYAIADAWVPVLQALL